MSDDWFSQLYPIFSDLDLEMESFKENSQLAIEIIKNSDNKNAIVDCMMTAVNQCIDQMNDLNQRLSALKNNICVDVDDFCYNILIGDQVLQSDLIDLENQVEYQAAILEGVAQIERGEYSSSEEVLQRMQARFPQLNLYQQPSGHICVSDFEKVLVKTAT
jgi:predicted transcriptional regulator